MRDKQESDDELLSADRRWWRRWYVISVAFAVVAVALAMVWFEFVLTNHPFQRLGLSPEAGQQLIVAAPLVVIFCVVFALRYLVGRPPGMQNESAVRKTADRHYARMRWVYPFSMALIAMTLFGARARVWERSALELYTFLFAMAVQMVVILKGFGWWSKSFRRGLDDELTRALRAKAAKFGYGLTAAILIAACVYARYRPVSADILLLQILFIISVTPVLYFLFLEWQSGRNG